MWKWFNAQSVPDGGNLLALSQLLGVRVEWLQYGMDYPAEPVTLSTLTGHKNVFRVDSLDIIGQESASGVPARDEVCRNHPGDRVWSG